MANLNVIGVSYQSQTSLAITDCLDQITQGLMGRMPNYLLVFADLNLDHKNLALELKSRAPQAQIIGITTSHISLNNQRPHLAIIGLHLDNTKIITSIGNNISQDPITATNQIINQIMGSTNNQSPLEIILLTSQPTNLDIVLKHLYSSLPAPIPIHSLTAFGFPQTHPPYIFYDNQILPDAIIAMAIYQTPFINATTYHTTTPIGVPLPITKQKDNLIQEINHLPACTLYEQYLPAYKLNRLPQTQFINLTTSFPLCLYTHPDLTIVAPQSANDEAHLVLPIQVPLDCQLVSLATHDPTQIETHIAQSLTNLINSQCTISFTSYNRHTDNSSEQSETQAIQKNIDSPSLLTITPNSFITTKQSPISISLPGRTVINFS